MNTAKPIVDMLELTVSELILIADDSEKPVIDRTIARALINDCKSGSLSTINYILDRRGNRK